MTCCFAHSLSSEPLTSDRFCLLTWGWICIILVSTIWKYVIAWALAVRCTMANSESKQSGGGNDNDSVFPSLSFTTHCYGHPLSCYLRSPHVQPGLILFLSPYCKVCFSTENYTGYSYRHGNIGILKFNWTKIALHKPPNYPSFIAPVSVPMASDSGEITLDSFLFLETCNSVFTRMIPYNLIVWSAMLWNH